MLQSELTGDLKKRLSTVKGQIEGIIKMLDEEKDPDRILVQFKAADQGLQKAHYLDIPRQTEPVIPDKLISMALIYAVAAVFAFYGPRLTTTKLANMRKPGIGGSFVYGLIFSLGTSAAPLLLLLAVAAVTANPIYGFILALVFAIGRGLPFLVVSAFAGAVTKFAQLTWLRRSIQIVSALALLYVCYYYLRVFIDLQ